MCLWVFKDVFQYVLNAFLLNSLLRTPKNKKPSGLLLYATWLIGVSVRDTGFVHVLRGCTCEKLGCIVLTIYNTHGAGTLLFKYFPANKMKV